MHRARWRPGFCSSIFRSNLSRCLPRVLIVRTTRCLIVMHAYVPQCLVLFLFSSAPLFTCAGLLFSLLTSSRCLPTRVVTQLDACHASRTCHRAPATTGFCSSSSFAYLQSLPASAWCAHNSMLVMHRVRDMHRARWRPGFCPLLSALLVAACQRACAHNSMLVMHAYVPPRALALYWFHALFSSALLSSRCLPARVNCGTTRCLIVKPCCHNASRQPMDSVSSPAPLFTYWFRSSIFSSAPCPVAACQRVLNCAHDSMLNCHASRVRATIRAGSLLFLFLFSSAPLFACWFLFLFSSALLSSRLPARVNAHNSCLSCIAYVPPRAGSLRFRSLPLLSPVAPASARVCTQLGACHASYVPARATTVSALFLCSTSSRCRQRVLKKLLRATRCLIVMHRVRYTMHAPAAYQPVFTPPVCCRYTILT